MKPEEKRAHLEPRASPRGTRTHAQASCGPPHPSRRPAPTLCISKGVGSSSSCISSGEGRTSRPLRQGRWPGLPSRATLGTVPVMMDACEDTALHSDTHSVLSHIFGHLLCVSLQGHRGEEHRRGAALPGLSGWVTQTSNQNKHPWH